MNNYISSPPFDMFLDVLFEYTRQSIKAFYRCVIIIIVQREWERNIMGEKKKIIINAYDNETRKPENFLFVVVFFFFFFRGKRDILTGYVYNECVDFIFDFF